MLPPVNVLAVATAVPQYELEQRAVADAARQVYGRTFARFPKLADVFVNAGIERRYSVRSLEWLQAPHDFDAQMFMSKARANCLCSQRARRWIVPAFRRATSMLS